ncbi:MAG: SDR family oxidoreductase [Kiritimatiellae bacterium]|nr:SDR family oxidoreductase [Kiritimatiellia bacterium]
MKLLKNKGILITGASRGLGAVCARALAEQGARLVLMARSRDKLGKVRSACAFPERHRVCPVDLMDMRALAEGVAAAKDFLGTFDVVLHVAGGGLGLREPLIKAEDLLKLFTLNVVAVAEINRLVAPDMMRRRKGNLVHVASIAAGEATASVGYNAVKAALAAYVRSLGNELAACNVICTGILPGGFHAPGNSWARLQATKPEVVKKFIRERLPRQRLANAKELIPLLLFLCSDASSMMSGCLVPIDAGEGKAYVQT